MPILRDAVARKTASAKAAKKSPGKKSAYDKLRAGSWGPLVEALEDSADLRDAKRVMARIKSGKEKTVSAEQVFRRNGLRT